MSITHIQLHDCKHICNNNIKWLLFIYFNSNLKLSVTLLCCYSCIVLFTSDVVMSFLPCPWLFGCISTSLLFSSSEERFSERFFLCFLHSHKPAVSVNVSPRVSPWAFPIPRACVKTMFSCLSIFFYLVNLIYTTPIKNKSRQNWSAFGA